MNDSKMHFDSKMEGYHHPGRSILREDSEDSSSVRSARAILGLSSYIALFLLVPRFWGLDWFSFTALHHCTGFYDSLRNFRTDEHEAL